METLSSKTLTVSSIMAAQRNFASCIKTVEEGFMTKDLAILVGVNQEWMETKAFINKISEKLSFLMEK